MAEEAKALAEPIKIPAEVEIAALRRFLGVAEEQRNDLAHANMELRAQKSEMMEVLATQQSVMEQARTEIERLTALAAGEREQRLDLRGVLDDAQRRITMLEQAPEMILTALEEAGGECRDLAINLRDRLKAKAA